MVRALHNYEPAYYCELALFHIMVMTFSCFLFFPDFSITSFSSNNNNLAGSDDFTITCVAGVTMNGTDSLNVTIRDSFNMILASDIFSAPMAGQYSVNYTFSQLSPSDAGTYTCVLTATVGNMSQAVNNSLDVTGMCFEL